MKKKKVFYILSQLYAYGEIASQVWRLRNLYYDQDNYDITIITYPLQKLRVNKSLYNIAMRGLNVVHSTDDKMIWFPQDYPSNKIFEDDDSIFVNLESGELRNLFLQKYQNKTPNFFFKLSKNELKMGNQLMDHYKIPSGSPIITLHVRETGYKNSHGRPEGSDGTLRNAKIETFFPTIKYLLDEGYYIVRLGDNTMTQIPFNHKRLIDVPFCSFYNDLVDLFFISKSFFFICSPSGPLTIADAFATPRLITNFPIWEHVWAWKNDLYLFKKYYSYQKNKLLSYEDILCSEVLNIPNINKAKELKIEVIDNTSEEIFSAVKEMIARLKGNYFSSQEMKSINKYFRCIQFKASKLHSEYTTPILNLFDNKNVPISLEYIRLNRHFIDLK